MLEELSSFFTAPQFEVILLELFLPNKATIILNYTRASSIHPRQNRTRGLWDATRLKLRRNVVASSNLILVRTPSKQINSIRDKNTSRHLSCSRRSFRRNQFKSSGVLFNKHNFIAFIGRTTMRWLKAIGLSQLRIIVGTNIRIKRTSVAYLRKSLFFGTA